MSDCAMLTCAVAGGVVTGNPNQPVNRDDVIREAVGAARAGASILHIHARTPSGEMTQAPEDYVAIRDAVREQVEDWKERGQREFRWFRYQRAAGLVAEPSLRRLIREFGKARTPGGYGDYSSCPPTERPATSCAAPTRSWQKRASAPTGSSSARTPGRVLRSVTTHGSSTSKECSPTPTSSWPARSAEVNPLWPNPWPAAVSPSAGGSTWPATPKASGLPWPGLSAARSSSSAWDERPD